MRIRNTIILIFLMLLSSCNKPRYNFDRGIIPVEVVNFAEVNSAWDDYNSDLVISAASSYLNLFFSTNRYSRGADFDFASYHCVFSSSLITLSFSVWAEEEPIPLIDSLNTAANEYGPYATFQGYDHYSWNEYDSIMALEQRFFYASDKNGNLDIMYASFKNDDYSFEFIDSTHMLASLNTEYDEGYLCLFPGGSTEKETAYFTSNRDGNFDIFSAVGEEAKQIERSETVEITKNTILSSDDEDKCPFISKNMMVFTSNRAGGFGGYDLYYSIFNGQEWSVPVNFGAAINTEYDEYRPIIFDTSDEAFINDLLIFSSNRPGGMGGFDLYYTGMKPMDKY